MIAPGETDAAQRSTPDRARPGAIVRRIYTNLGKLLGGKAIAGVFSLAYLLIAVRALNPRDYGILILLHTYTITVGGIVEFPGWQAIVRYGSQALDAGNVPRLIRLLRFTTIVEIACGFLAVTAAALLAPWIGPRLGWTPEAMTFAVPYSLAALATIRSIPQGYLQLRGRFDLVGLHHTFSPAVRLIGAGTAFLSGAGLIGFLTAWLVAALFEWISMWALGIWQVRRDIAGHRLIGSPLGVVGENPRLLRFMVAANADVTLGDLAQRLSSLTIGWVLGPAMAGIFALAQRATSIVSQPATHLGQAAYAELARMLTAGASGAELRQTFLRCAGIALAMAAPFFVVFALFGDEIARFLGGKAFQAAGSIMLILFAGRAVLLVAPPASAALVALGHPGISFVANLACSLGLLSLLPLLTGRFGLIGAGYHALVQALATVTLLCALLWRQTRTS